MFWSNTDVDEAQYHDDDSARWMTVCRRHQLQTFQHSFNQSIQFTAPVYCQYGLLAAVITSRPITTPRQAKASERNELKIRYDPVADPGGRINGSGVNPRRGQGPKPRKR